jgi:hypothetical protein
MKYMLMMNTPRGGEYQIMSWPKRDIEAHIAFMIDYLMLRAARLSDTSAHDPAEYRAAATRTE